MIVVAIETVVEVMAAAGAVASTAAARVIDEVETFKAMVDPMANVATMAVALTVVMTAMIRALRPCDRQDRTCRHDRMQRHRRHGLPNNGDVGGRTGRKLQIGVETDRIQPRSARF